DAETRGVERVVAGQLVGVRGEVAAMELETAARHGFVEAFHQAVELRLVTVLTASTSEIGADRVGLDLLQGDHVGDGVEVADRLDDVVERTLGRGDASG